MQKRQLIGLFLVNGAPYIIGHSVLPIFPIHLKSLGADESMMGFYLAVIFMGLFLGTLASGWLSDYFRTRRPLIYIGLGMMSLSMYLMTLANTPFTLSALMTMAWMGGGLSGGMVNTLAGLYADKAKRGQVFGILGIARGTAGVLGGIIGSIVIKHWDYNGLFISLAIVQAAILLGSGLIEDRIPVNPAAKKRDNEATPMLSGTFLALLTAGVLVSAVHFGAGLGRPLKMNVLELSASAIMTTSILAGAAGMIAPYLTGWLSDRIERKQLLIACYGSIVLGTAILVESTALWHFWISTVLFNIGIAGQGIGAALVTDMLPKEALSTGLARYTSTPWLGAAIGYSAGGLLIKALDLDLTFVLLAILPVIAIGLITSINPRRPIRVTQTQTVAAVGGD